MPSSSLEKRQSEKLSEISYINIMGVMSLEMLKLNHISISSIRISIMLSIETVGNGMPERKGMVSVR